MLDGTIGKEIVTRRESFGVTMLNYIASLKEDFKVPSRRMPNLHIGGELTFVISLVSIPYLAFVFGARGGGLLLALLMALIAAAVLAIAAEATIRRSLWYDQEGYDYYSDEYEYDNDVYEYDPEGVTEEIPVLSNYRGRGVHDGYEEAA